MTTRSRFDVELERVVTELDQLAEDAQDCEQDAVADKIRESLGSLTNARQAARQYAAGILPEPPPVYASDMPCPQCLVAPTVQCVPTAARGGWMSSGIHDARSDAARRATSDRLAAQLALLG